MSSSSGLNDLMELSRHLKQEKLFIGAEKDQLLALHAGVGSSAEQLYHKSWIARQQKTTLDRLILASGDATPSACCQRVSTTLSQTEPLPPLPLYTWVSMTRATSISVTVMLRLSEHFAESFVETVGNISPLPIISLPQRNLLRNYIFYAL